MLQKIFLIIILLNIPICFAQGEEELLKEEEAREEEQQDLPLTPLLPNSKRTVCDRTLEVQEAILKQLHHRTDCAEVSDEDLSTIKVLDLHNRNIMKLQFDDFKGLTSLEWLSLAYNKLSSLPEGVFSDLQALQSLYLKYNQLSSLPEGIFSSLDSLWELYIEKNRLSLKERERLRRQWGGKVQI